MNIPKGYTETVYRRTDNTMAKIKRIWQTTISKTINRKQKVETHWNRGWTQQLRNERVAKYKLHTYGKFIMVKLKSSPLWHSIINIPQYEIKGSIFCFCRIVEKETIAKERGVYHIVMVLRSRVQAKKPCLYFFLFCHFVRESFPAFFHVNE